MGDSTPTTEVFRFGTPTILRIGVTSYEGEPNIRDSRCWIDVYVMIFS